MTPSRVVEDLCGDDVHRYEQVGRLVALVAMGRPGSALGHRQGGLGPVERLDLGLTVEAEDDGPLWRVQVKADDGDEFLLEARIGGHLQGVGPSRLQVMVGPDPRHDVPADPEPFGQGARAPVRRTVVRKLLQGGPDHFGDRPLFKPRLTTSARSDLPDASDNPLLPDC